MRVKAQSLRRGHSRGGRRLREAACAVDTIPWPNDAQMRFGATANTFLSKVQHHTPRRRSRGKAGAAKAIMNGTTELRKAEARLLSLSPLDHGQPAEC